MSIDQTPPASQLDLTPVLPRPRIRAGAIAWGLIVCSVSVAVLVTISSPEGRAGFAEWALALGVGGVALVLLLTLGFLIVLWSLLSIIRHAQKRRALSLPSGDVHDRPASNLND